MKKTHLLFSILKRLQSGKREIVWLELSSIKHKTQNARKVQIYDGSFVLIKMRLFNLYIHIYAELIVCKTANDMWTRMQTRYLQRASDNKHLLLKEFMNATYVNV